MKELLDQAVLAILVVICIALWLVLRRRSPALARDAVRAGWWDFLVLLPRLTVGVIGAGFLAAMLPEEMVATWLGPESGFIGIAVATFAGSLTPGGPVVGFAIGTGALAAGAGAPQVVAYVTSWALLAIQRVILWETPMLSGRFVAIRLAVSLPLPFLAAALAILAGRP